MSTASRVIKNTGFLYFRIAITMIVAFWTTRIILNALGEDDFGVYSLVGVVVSLLGFLNASLSGATQRFINFTEAQNDPEAKTIIFNNSLTLHSILAAGLVVLLAVIGVIAFDFFLEIPPGSYFAAKCVYACMICTTAISVLNVPYEAEINAHEDMQVYAIIGTIDASLKLAIAFIVKNVESNRLILYGVLMALVPVITLIALRVYCHTQYSECRVHLLRYFRKNVIKQLSSFAGWNFINTASSVVAQSGLNIVINKFFGVTLNTAQGITNQVGGALMNLSSNIEKALNPIIVKREGANQREGMLYVSLLGCRMTFFIFSFFAVFLISEMSLVLHIWLKNVPAWTVLFCQLQLVRVAIELLTRGVHMAIMAQGNIKLYSICRSVINILPIILTIWAFYCDLAPYWMYIIWIATWSVLGGCTSLWFAKRNIGLSFTTYLDLVLKPSLKSILPSILLVWGCKTFVMNVSIDVSLNILAELIYLLLAYKFLLNTFERDEIKRLFGKIRRRVHL